MFPRIQAGGEATTDAVSSVFECVFLRNLINRAQVKNSLPSTCLALCTELFEIVACLFVN
jgi:hypothetical protein